MSNEWFERGELPPVGVRFEAYFERDSVPNWSAGIVAYKSDEHIILMFDNGDEVHYTASSLARMAKFRPIRTEREKAIEAAALVIEINHGSSGSLLYKKYCESLYDAGLLRLPEDKK